MRIIGISIIITLALLAFCDEDYYSILGVATDASNEDIKKAFRKQVRMYHPDKYPDTEMYTKVCQGKLRSAITCSLSNSCSKSRYDNERTPPKPQHAKNTYSPGEWLKTEDNFVEMFRRYLKNSKK